MMDVLCSQVISKEKEEKKRLRDQGLPIPVKYVCQLGCITSYD